MNIDNDIFDLLDLNGAKFIEKELYDDSEIIYHYDLHGYGIDICLDEEYSQYNEIVFIDENGDFAAIKYDYYALVGFLIEYNLIHIGYKSPIKFRQALNKECEKCKEDFSVKNL